MTPPDQDDHEATEAEPAEPDQDASDPPDDDPAAAPKRGRRKRIIKAKRDELVDWVLAEAENLGQPRTVVLRGEGIGRSTAELDKVGSALSRLAGLLKEVGGEPRLGGGGLSFANSIHVELRPSEDELRRSSEALRDARVLDASLEVETEAESAERREVVRELRSSAVPDLDVALALAGDLISAPVDEAPLRAAELGTEVAVAYRSLANAIAKEGVALALPSVRVVDAKPEVRVVNLSPARAERVAKALSEVDEPTRAVVEVLGKLSLADATKRRFGLDLDPEAPRPEALKRKRVIRGSYTPAAEGTIIAEGLWSTWVHATIEIERDVLISSSRLRPPRYVLVAVRPGD